MKAQLDMDKIAKGLRAERGGRVAAKGGHLGAHQLAAEIQARFRAPVGGGRATVADWTERRLVPLRPKTLKWLELAAAKLTASGGVTIEPMQLAALLLERAAEDAGDGEAEETIAPPDATRKAAR